MRMYKTPIPMDDPLDWKDSKTYKEIMDSGPKEYGSTNCGND